LRARELPLTSRGWCAACGASITARRAPTNSAASLPAPLVAWARSRFADPEERRRVRLFLFGLAAGIMPLIINVFAEAASPAVARAMTIPQVRARLAMLHYSLLLTVPLTTGYAVVAHRLLDIRLLLRRAARVAFARRAAAVMGVLPSALLLLHLIGQRARPLASVFTERTTAALLIFAAAGWALFATRKHLLSRVERQLSGSLTDPALVLAGFAHEAQAVRSVAELERLVRLRLGELAGAEHAAMLLYDRERGSYASLEGRIRPVPASSALATLIAALPEPAALAEGGMMASVLTVARTPNPFPIPEEVDQDSAFQAAHWMANSLYCPPGGLRGFSMFGGFCTHARDLKGISRDPYVLLKLAKVFAKPLRELTERDER
jgi:hypothetical protein